MGNQEIAKLLIQKRKKIVKLMLKVYPNLCVDCKKIVLKKQLSSYNDLCIICQEDMKQYLTEFEEMFK
jgi:hypothetical protein